jgi:hypothetical protein
LYYAAKLIELNSDPWRLGGSQIWPINSDFYRKVAVHRWVLTTPLLLTIIKLLKVGALLSWGRFSFPESPAPISTPIPQ